MEENRPGKLLRMAKGSFKISDCADCAKARGFFKTMN